MTDMPNGLPREIRAQYGGRYWTHTWKWLYEDQYQCQCCGTIQPLSHLVVITKRSECDTPDPEAWL